MNWGDRMKRSITGALATTLLAVVLTGSAWAQAPTATTPAPSAPAAAPAAKEKGKAPPKTATTPEGATCSAEADAKGLKGKERRSFRRKCIAAIKKGQPTPTAPAPGTAAPAKGAPPPAPKATVPAPATKN
jgi:psiF repeat